jgi:hypothetical protein
VAATDVIKVVGANAPAYLLCARAVSRLTTNQSLHKSWKGRRLTRSLLSLVLLNVLGDDVSDLLQVRRGMPGALFWRFVFICEIDIASTAASKRRGQSRRSEQVCGIHHGRSFNNYRHNRATEPS